MDAKKMKDARQRLTVHYEMLIKSITRNRIAAEEINMENTEDEGDLAIMSHNKHLLYSLDQAALSRLTFIKEAIKALDRGQYGRCVNCDNDINQKRLLAVPWVTLCIRCQEQTEADRVSSDMALANLEEVTDF